MNRWALVVAGLYILILAVLTVPLILLAGFPKVDVEEAVKAFVYWQYWLWLSVMALSQFALRRSRCESPAGGRSPREHSGPRSWQADSWRGAW